MGKWLLIVGLLAGCAAEVVPEPYCGEDGIVRCTEDPSLWPRCGELDEPWELPWCAPGAGITEPQCSAGVPYCTDGFIPAP